MSQSNSMVGCTDIINLVDYPFGRYFFELSHLPILRSLVIYFDEFNNITRLNSVFTGYDREDFIDYKLVKITDNVEEDSNENYECVYFNSEDANKYAKSLIGTTTFASLDSPNIITLTDQPSEDTYYLNFKELLKGKIFIDFSDSEKIKSILDQKNVDGFHRACTQFATTYFYDA